VPAAGSVCFVTVRPVPASFRRTPAAGTARAVPTGVEYVSAVVVARTRSIRFVKVTTTSVPSDPTACGKVKAAVEPVPDATTVPLLTSTAFHVVS
jgi:hypothetical protein